MFGRHDDAWIDSPESHSHQMQEGHVGAGHVGLEPQLAVSNKRDSNQQRESDNEDDSNQNHVTPDIVGKLPQQWI